MNDTLNHINDFFERQLLPLMHLALGIGLKAPNIVRVKSMNNSASKIVAIYGKKERLKQPFMTT